MCTQNWDDWKGGGHKNNLIVVYPQHGLSLLESTMH